MAEENEALRLLFETYMGMRLDEMRRVSPTVRCYYLRCYCFAALAQACCLQQLGRALQGPSRRASHANCRVQLRMTA